MAVKIEIPNQEGLKCSVCGTRSEKSLIHQIELAGQSAKTTLILCDICVADLKDAVRDY